MKRHLKTMPYIKESRIKKYHVTYRLTSSSIKLIKRYTRNNDTTFTEYVTDQIKQANRYSNKMKKINEINMSIDLLLDEITEKYYDNEDVIELASDVPCYIENRYIINSDFLHSEKKKRAFRFTKRTINSIIKLQETLGMRTPGDVISFIVEYLDTRYTDNKLPTERMVQLQNVTTFINVKYHDWESNRIRLEVQKLWQKCQKL